MMTYEQDNHSLSNDKEAKIVWRNSMMRIANTIISKSEGEGSLKRICQKLLLELDEKIERELSRVKFGVDANVVENEVIQCDTTNEMPCLPNEVSVLNPPCVRSKGLRNTRLNGHFEKRRANTSKDAFSLRHERCECTIYIYVARRIFSYVHSFVTRVGKGRAGSGYEKGRVGVGAEARTRRART
ncbi:hypothetical protein SO802_030665 [Lithocarpus litseifolius]|uniref:Uncharacterized protein n=1 Tax=Lithocarpus litseifolius TaxID=425828 RepID=A0AAW2BLM6_9ROSI